MSLIRLIHVTEQIDAKKEKGPVDCLWPVIILWLFVECSHYLVPTIVGTGCRILAV